jgi:F-type H+-transporting ATPase subunit gamma
VLTSNRGMCGGYNAAILREANAHIRQLAGQGVNLHLEVSGRRGIAWFRYQGVKAEKTYTQFEDKPAFDEVEPLADRYIQGYVSGQLDRVEVAYMKFLNAAVQKPVVETLLPLDEAPAGPAAGAQAAAGPRERPAEYEFLPGAEDILQELLPVSFKVRLFKCFLDAAVSEQIARRVTMKQATENADDMIKTLSRQYNRARQAQITKEIMEVIGGAEALK